MVITAYDDATAAATAEHLDALKALGLAADLEDKFTWSYVAVIEDGHVRFEQAAPEEITYEGVTENGVAVRAVSAGSVVRMIPMIPMCPSNWTGWSMPCPTAGSTSRCTICGPDS